MSRNAVLDLLAAQERARARARAARAAGNVALAGAAAVAAALFLERAGVDLPLLALPFSGGVGTPGLRVFAWLLVSLAGLAQGALLLACVLAAAGAVWALAPPLLRRRPERTARDLDAALRRDCFSAALEARGPFEPLVRATALRARVPPRALAGPPLSRLRRALIVAAFLLVALVALSPGTAPGGEGAAPVAGAEDTGQRIVPFALMLLGERRDFFPHEPVPVRVLGEAPEPPSVERSLPVLLRIDGEAPRPTGRVLTLGARDEFEIDLRAFANGLAPGEHVAVALAGGARSNEYRFRIEPSLDAPPPPPPPPPAPAPPSPDSGGGIEAKPRFVEPLVREGPTVPKDARVPIERPGGAAAEERTVEEAWPELVRRMEAALDRPGLSPSSRALVREYFERLRPR